MRNNDTSKKFKVIKARSFLGSLAAIVALSSVLSVSSLTLTSCGHKHDKHTIENVIEDEMETTIVHEHEHNHEHEHDDEEIIHDDEKDSEIKEVVPEKEEEKEIEEVILEEKETSEVVINSTDLVIPNIKGYEGISIVEALARAGYNSSFSYRKQLAEFFGITNYKGTAEQNLLLLDYLRNYNIVKEEVPVVPSTPVETPAPKDDNGDKTRPDNEDEKHKHSFGAWKSLSDTQEIRSCSCGKTQKRGHSYGDWIGNNDGTETRKCNTCGHEMTRDIEHEHNYGEWEYLNNDSEERTCSCGAKETRNHSLGTANITYIDLDNGTHKKVSVSPCNTCNHDITLEEINNCDYSEWKYNKDTELEERSCNDCGHTETREHVHMDAPENLVYGNETPNNDGTHKMTATYTCRTCNKLVTVEKNENCSFGEWTYNLNTNLEERSCRCGYTETREHVHMDAPDNLVYGNETPNNDGTHKMTASYYCTTCNNLVTVEKIEDCSFGEWTYFDALYDIKECGKCGYDLKTSHTPDASGMRVEQGSTKDKHEEIYTCANCNHDIAHEVDCTPGSTVYYETRDGVVIEYNICTECGKKCNVASHSHSLSYEAINDDEERQYCTTCGYETIGSHDYPTDWSVDESGLNYKTCSTCGHTKTQSHTHSMDSSIVKVGTEDCCYKIIEECNVDGCDYTVETPVSSHTEATETVGVMTRYYCSECGFEIKTEINTNSQSLEDEVTPELYSNAVTQVLEEISKEEEIIEEEIIDNTPTTEGGNDDYKEEESLEDTETKSLTLSL